MTSIPPTATYSSFLVPTCGMPGEGQRSPRPPRVTWTPGWVPVAAICGATAGLVRAGLLDNRRHTSAAAGYLMATGYAGGDHYLNQRAVMDGISSRPARSRLCSSRRCDAAALGPGIGSQLDAYEGVFHRADTTASPALMDAQDAA